MGKLTNFRNSNKLYEQQNDFSGGINVNEENINLRDNESRDIVNMHLDSRGSLKKRTGSEVIFDLGYSILTKKRWFQGTRPNPDYNAEDQTSEEYITGFFTGVNPLEYQSFLEANKLLGHFTYEDNGVINHYIATMSGIYDSSGNPIQVYSYNIDKEGTDEEYYLNPNVPYDYKEEMVWDWYITPTEKGLWLERYIVDKTDPNNPVSSVELDLDGNPVRYPLKELGRLGYGDASDPNNNEWWPVVDGKIVIRWDDTIPSGEGVPDDLLEVLQNTFNPPIDDSGVVKPHFYLGGNFNKHKDENWNFQTLQNISRIVLDDKWFQQQIGLGLNRYTTSKYFYNKDSVGTYEINSLQYKDDTYIMMDGKIYTFSPGDGRTNFLKEVSPYKPTFQEYNQLKGNMLASLGYEFNPNTKSSYDILWNWNWTQDPNITSEGEPTPIALGIMGNNIQVTGRNTRFKALAIDKRQASSGDDAGWKYIWKLLLNEGGSDGNYSEIYLTPRPSKSAYYNNLIIPATEIASLIVTASLNGVVTAVPKEDFQGLTFSRNNSRLFFIRQLQSIGQDLWTIGTKRYNWEWTEGLTTNLATPDWKLEDSWLYESRVTTKAADPRVSGGSGLGALHLKLGFELPQTLTDYLFYKKDASEVVSLFFKHNDVATQLARVFIDNNVDIYTIGGYKGVWITNAMAYLSFDSERMQNGDSKWTRLQSAGVLNNVKDKIDTSAQMLNQHKYFSSAWSQWQQPIPADGTWDLGHVNMAPKIRGKFSMGENKKNGQTATAPILSWYPNEMKNWILNNLVSPLPGTNIMFVGNNWWNGGSAHKFEREVPFQLERLETIDFGKELKSMSDVILGTESISSEDKSEYISPLGANAWTTQELQAEKIIFNIVLSVQTVPWYSDANLGRRGWDSGFWGKTRIWLNSGTGTTEADAKYFTNSTATVSSPIGTGATTYILKYPLTPINNLEAYLPSIVSLGYINTLNNAYVYKSQYFTWNTEKSIMFYSDINNFKYFPVIQTFELVDYPDEQIQAMQIYGEAALIFTKNRIYRLTGSSVEDFAVLMVNDSVGSINPRTVKSIGNAVYFISRKGAYRLKRSYSADNQLLVEPIDLKIKGLYNPNELVDNDSKIICTAEGEKYYVHILNQHTTLVYDTINDSWTRNIYDIKEDISWIRTINNETYYITNDYKICRFYTQSDVLDSLKVSTAINSNEALNLHSLYIDQLNKPLLFLADGSLNPKYKGNPNSSDAIEKQGAWYFDVNGNPLDWNMDYLERYGLGYRINAIWKTKEWSGYAGQIHNRKKWKETQIKFTSDSYATSGYFELKVDGNEVITPNVYDYQLDPSTNEMQMIIKKTDYKDDPLNVSTLTRNSGSYFSRSYILSSGNYVDTTTDEVWEDGSEAADGYNYLPPLSSKLENNTESNMRRKRGKKGYVSQQIISNNETTSFGIKSMLLVYKVKKAK